MENPNLPALLPAAHGIGRPPLKLNIETLAAQIISLSGNISAVARVFGAHRHTIQARIDKHKGLKKLLEDTRETMLDNAESQLYTKVLAGDTLALIFFLKTQGKKRGYVERQELTGADGVPLYEEIADLLNEVYAGRQQQLTAPDLD
ncbi:MAG: hypothetical protein U0Y68_04090 [Blastocatellia bacterium]